MSDADTDGSEKAGIFRALGGGLHWIAGLMEPVRHLMVNVGVLTGLVVGGPAVYKQVTKTTFVIKDINVPPAISARGLTGDVIAQQILDHISDIGKQAGSKKEKAEISGIDMNTSTPSINLPVGGLNLAGIISELRSLFGFTETKITGEIYVAQAGDASKGIADQYGLRLRIAGQGPIYRTDHPSPDAQSLVDAAAQQIMRHYDPINLGYYYYRKKNFEKVSEITDEVIASGRPTDVPWALMMRGLIARDMGHMEEAVADLREAVTHAPNFMIGHTTLASLLRRAGDLEGAEAEARKAIALSPEKHDGYAALASVLVDRKRHDEALVEMKKGIEFEPKSAPAYFKLGRLHDRMKQPAEAEAAFRMAAALHPTASALIEAAKQAHEVRHDADSMQLLKEATRIEPKNAKAWLALGLEELDQKAYGRATRIFQKAIALDTDTPDTIISIVKALDAQKRLTDADQLLSHAPAKIMHNPIFLLGWSEHLWLEGRKQEATTKAQEAMASDALRAPVAASAARLMEERGDPVNALAAYQKAVLLDPSLEKSLQPTIDRLLQRKVEPVASTSPPSSPAPATQAALPKPVPAPVAATPPPRPAAVHTVPPVVSSLPAVQQPRPIAPKLAQPATIPQ